MGAADPKVLDKLRKLLALSGSSEPHEAALALDEKDVQSIATATRVKGWEARLLAAVADAFACRLLFLRRYPYGVYSFVGPRQDAELAAYAATVLLRKLRKARAAFTNTLPDYYDRAMTSRTLGPPALVQRRAWVRAPWRDA